MFNCSLDSLFLSSLSSFHGSFVLSLELDFGKFSSLSSFSLCLFLGSSNFIFKFLCSSSLLLKFTVKLSSQFSLIGLKTFSSLLVRSFLGSNHFSMSIDFLLNGFHSLSMFKIILFLDSLQSCNFCFMFSINGSQSSFLSSLQISLLFCLSSLSCCIFFFFSFL